MMPGLGAWGLLYMNPYIAFLSVLTSWDGFITQSSPGEGSVEVLPGNRTGRTTTWTEQTAVRHTVWLYKLMTNRLKLYWGMLM